MSYTKIKKKKLLYAFVVWTWTTSAVLPYPNVVGAHNIHFMPSGQLQTIKTGLDERDVIISSILFPLCKRQNFQGQLD
jgi:hypothetical protein